MGQAMAQESFIDKLKNDVRPFVVKILGVDTANKILGESDSHIQLPEIPEVAKSNKDFNGIQDQDRFNKLSKEKREKLNYYYVKGIFESVRNQGSTNDDLAKWMNVVNQGGSLEGVYHALVLDNTYAGLENFEQPASTAAINFAVEYLDTYLARHVERSDLEGSNFYRIKRIVTERTIETMKSMASNREDLNNWYAVLSHDLASNRSQIWKNKLRKSTSKKMHQKWSNKAPFSFVASEVIIKLHKTFNHLKNQ
jgi:hypothetical protein